MIKFFNILAFMCSVAIGECGISYATVFPRSIGGESRIKLINYMPNAVFKYTGHYLYQSIIEFEDDEEIKTIAMGTPNSWQLIPSINRMFLKPVAEDAETNMTVLTNKRMYFFEMHAKSAKGVSDKELAFIVKFIYPENNNIKSVSDININSGPDLSSPLKYNLRYSIAGYAKDIEPIQIFDDGEFTFFRFRQVNTDLPAIFMVNDDGTESLINHRIQDNYVVVERVAKMFTLRSGNMVLCVYNDAHDEYLKNGA